MKKINKSFLKTFSAILVALLGLFGFSNCNDAYTEFKVTGKVTNAADGKPVKGIRVSRLICEYMYGPPMPNYSNKSPVFTDKNGNYTMFLNDTIPNSLVFEDIDGNKNGAFRDTAIYVNFNGEKVANIDIALTPKE